MCWAQNLAGSAIGHASTKETASMHGIGRRSHRMEGMSRQGGSSGAGLRLLLLLAIVAAAGGTALALLYQLVGSGLPPEGGSVAHAAAPQAPAQSAPGVSFESLRAALQDAPEQSPSTAPQEAVQAQSRGEFITHIVQRGDTLFALARRHGTTVQAIKAANGLKCDKIIVGQKLRIPVAVVCPKPVVTVCPTPVPAVVPACPQKVVVACPPPVVVVVCPPQPVCMPVCPVVCVPAVDP
jgi:LysM repeat protein